MEIAEKTLSVLEKFRPLFYPESVALVGASSNSAKIGYLALQNILQWGFKGQIFPINPDGKEILGLKSYPSLAAIPAEKVDLALIARPARELPALLEECLHKGIKGAVIVSGGMKEMGIQNVSPMVLRERPVARTKPRILALGLPPALLLLSPPGNLIVTNCRSSLWVCDNDNSFLPRVGQ